MANNNKGEITSKEIIITAGATIAAAIIIVVVFIVISNKKDTTLPTDQTDITDVTTTTPDIQKPTDKDKGKEEEPSGPETVIYEGNITQINETNIVINAGESEYIVIEIDEDTSIIHQGKIFDKSELHLGDSLRITAERITATKALAQQIQVLISASPTTTKSINPNVQTDPLGIPVAPSKRKAL